MSILENKSKANIKAAETLITNCFYAPSVHCSYYSCVQAMFNIVYEVLGTTKEELLKKCKEDATGSHQRVINEVKRELHQRSNNYSEIQSFNQKIFALKRNREDADYHQVNIDEIKSKSSLELAKKINYILAKSFNS